MSSCIEKKKTQSPGCTRPYRHCSHCGYHGEQLLRRCCTSKRRGETWFCSKSCYKGHWMNWTSPNQGHWYNCKCDRKTKRRWRLGPLPWIRTHWECSQSLVNICRCPMCKTICWQGCRTCKEKNTLFNLTSFSDSGESE